MRSSKRETAWVWKRRAPTRTFGRAYRITEESAQEIPPEGGIQRVFEEKVTIEKLRRDGSYIEITPETTVVIGDEITCTLRTGAVPQMPA